MLRVNEFQFYELAVAVHPLTAASGESKYSEVWLDWTSAAEKLNGIFSQRALEFCLETATALYSAVVDVVPAEFPQAIQKYQEMTAQSPEPPIGWGSVHPIVQAANRFETLLSAELSNSDTYWITPKGTHKTPMLLKSARAMLPGFIIRAVPEAAADFDEAGKCWLFDTHTAVGFHLMRAIDAVMRSYYRAVVGVEPKKKFRNWGAYISRLKTCPAADPKIIDFLGQIKESYRNPVLHPEQNLSADDAQILFGVAISVISMMGHAIERLTAKGGTLPLTQNAELTDSVGS